MPDDNQFEPRQYQELDQRVTGVLSVESEDMRESTEDTDENMGQGSKS